MKKFLSFSIFFSVALFIYGCGSTSSDSETNSEKSIMFDGNFENGVKTTKNADAISNSKGLEIINRDFSNQEEVSDVLLSCVNDKNETHIYSGKFYNCSENTCYNFNVTIDESEAACSILLVKGEVFRESYLDSSSLEKSNATILSVSDPIAVLSQDTSQGEEKPKKIKMKCQFKIGKLLIKKVKPEDIIAQVLNDTDYQLNITPHTPLYKFMKEHKEKFKQKMSLALQKIKNYYQNSHFHQGQQNSSLSSQNITFNNMQNFNQSFHQNYQGHQGQGFNNMTQIHQEMNQSFHQCQENCTSLAGNNNMQNFNQHFHQGYQEQNSNNTTQNQQEMNSHIHQTQQNHISAQNTSDSNL